MFQFSGFASCSYVFTARWLADASRVSPFGNPRIKVCLQTPRGLSHATTSFIASYCLGIHRMRLFTWPYNPNKSALLLVFALRWFIIYAAGWVWSVVTVLYASATLSLFFLLEYLFLCPSVLATHWLGCYANCLTRLTLSRLSNICSLELVAQS